ncbi:MAG: YbeD family protein [Granulosicoccus sp.]
MSEETLIEFPADIAVKAMGLCTDDFEAHITELVMPHILPQAVTVTTLPSKGGKYISVSVRFTAQSLEQLHAVYGVLKKEPRVLYTL